MTITRMPGWPSLHFELVTDPRRIDDWHYTEEYWDDDGAHIEVIVDVLPVLDVESPALADDIFSELAPASDECGELVFVNTLRTEWANNHPGDHRFVSKGRVARAAMAAGFDVYHCEGGGLAVAVCARRRSARKARLGRYVIDDGFLRHPRAPRTP